MAREEILFFDGEEEQEKGTANVETQEPQEDEGESSSS